MFKKLLAVLVVCFIFVGLVGCSEKLPKVGILKLVSAEALTNAERGIVDALAKGGFVDGENIEIVYQCPEGDSNTLKIACEKLVRECEIIFSIATPATQTLLGEIEQQGKDIPVVFTAVTDPVASNIVSKVGAREENVTGTNDMNPVADQIKLMKELNPEMKKMGIIYTSSEDNSKIQSDIAESAAKEIGLEVVIKTINDSKDIVNTVGSLINDDIEALYVPTDNICSSNITAIQNMLNDANVYSVCGEEGMVNDGGLISYSIDYLALGKLTGEMGVKILKGEALAKDIKIEGLNIEDLALVINMKTANESGVNIPESLKNKANRVIE